MVHSRNMPAGRGQYGNNHSHADYHDDHNHDHIPKITQGNGRKILISCFIIFAFMLVEAAGGYISGSLALLADAGHMLTDAAALGLAYAAFQFGRRAADKQRSFGYLRFEVIAGFINAITLFAIAGWIIYEAAVRLYVPHAVLSRPMFIVALIGLIVNIFVLWFLTRGDTEHINIKGAILHVMSDLLGSVGAIIAAIVIYYTGFIPIDPILSVLVSLLIMRSAWALFKRTVNILLEGSPEGTDSAAIAGHLLKTVSGIDKVSHIHVWLITSGRALATLHIRPKAGANIPAAVKQVEHELRSKFNIEHPTVGIDWDNSEFCSLESSAKAEDHEN